MQEPTVNDFAYARKMLNEAKPLKPYPMGCVYEGNMYWKESEAADVVITPLEDDDGCPREYSTP